MKKFLRYCILFSLPLWIALIPYITTDPFMVLYHYDTYYPNHGKDWQINNNRGYVSTQMYLQNDKRYHYDSFIFGSSRSHTFRVNEWKKYIEDNASPIHFDGYVESLYNMHKRFLFLDGRSPINNAIICLDQSVLSQVEPNYTHIYATPPALDGYKNFGSFYMSHLRAYFTPKFFTAYWKLFLTGKSKPYMFDDEVIMEPDTVYYAPYNERWKRPVIEKFDDAYYSENHIVFSERDDSADTYPVTIGEVQKSMLTDIHDVLERNNTRYVVFLNPVYDQKRLDDTDMVFLKELFGDHLVDFSGKNIFTEDYHYYSDDVHFNTYVSCEMLRIAYTEDIEQRQHLLDSLYKFNR